MPDLVTAFLFLTSLTVPVFQAALAVGGVFPVTDDPRKPALDEPGFAAGISELG